MTENAGNDVREESRSRVSPRSDAHLERAWEIHRRIEALYSVIEDRHIYFRSAVPADSSLSYPIGMRRRGIVADPVVCALAIKAATTKRAIATLCELGDGDNALALTRVLMENAAMLQWLIRGERWRRLHAYIAFTSVAYERIVKIIERFRGRFIAAGADPQRQSDPKHQAIARHMFGSPKGNARSTWDFTKGKEQLSEVKLKAIFDEVSEGELSFEYEVLYGALGSDVVHSGPFSLSRILGYLDGRSTFVLEARPMVGGAVISLAISNSAMLLVLDSLDDYCGLGLSDVLDTLKREAQKDPMDQ